MKQLWSFKIVKGLNFVFTLYCLTYNSATTKTLGATEQKYISELKFPALCKVQTGFYETKYACPEHSVTVHTQDDSYQSHQSDLDQSKTKDTSFSTSNNHGSMNKRLFWSILYFLHQHFSLKSTQFWYYKFFVWKHFWLSIHYDSPKWFFQGLSFPFSILILYCLIVF